MRARHLAPLLVCSIVGAGIGSGLMPFLPIYALQLGLPEDAVGAYLAASYLALALGAILAGLLANRGRRRKALLVLIGLVDLPGVWLLGQVTAAWQVVVLTALVWLLGGMGLATISMLAGQQADSERRGTVFGALGLSGAAGSVVGALAVGMLVDTWGYPTMFGVIPLGMLAWLVAAAFISDHATLVCDAGAGGSLIVLAVCRCWSHAPSLADWDSARSQARPRCGR